MRLFLVLAFACSCICNSTAQLNINRLGGLTFPEDLSDIWGYTAVDGTEYALLGTVSATKVINLANPANPIEVLSVPGVTTFWRDLKTWGNYAYVIRDGGSDGLLIMDLSPLPSGLPTYTSWKPNLTVSGSLGTLNKGHNLYIDENGFLYLSGSNLGSGQTLIFNLNTVDGIPIYMGAAGTFYSHDAFARGDTLWSSDINNGWFSVWDVSNKAAPSFLASQSTPRNFCHNSWLSDDGNTLFTTDEKPNAYIAAYDVSDLSDIQELDRWRPLETEGNGVIPHNVHVLNDYIVTSHYEDGLKVIDGHRPSNLVEVASYDTYTGSSSGFFGAWGAYPFLPSGLVLVSDINTGFHVLDVTYQRACYLEGNVKDFTTGLNLSGVEVKILLHLEAEDTDLLGNYAMGKATSGNYMVRFSKSGYNSKTLSVNLSNGVVTILNVFLLPLGVCDDGVQNGDETGIDCGGSTCPACPLPVELTEFKGKQRSNQIVLNWRTATESNNKMFELMHSATGESWTKLGEVNGVGNTTEPSSYEFIHKRPLTGWNYYQLRQIDFDGKMTYSEILNVKLNSSGDNRLSIYPNPAASQFTIQNAIGRVEIFNTYGQLIKSVENSDYSATIDTDSFPNGCYQIVVHKNGLKLYHQLIINKS